MSSILAVPTNPLVLAVGILAMTLGAHLFLSIIIERRRVSWATEYPAMTLGDPVLALGCGLAAASNPPSGWPAGAHAGLVILASGVVFGACQSHWEHQRGRYTLAQIWGPSKLWHQFVVYPIVGHWVIASMVSGIRFSGEPSEIQLGVLAIACLLFWAATVIHAATSSRQGHGTWPRALRQMR